jgi:uncharacterized integral membrane protein
MSPKKLLRAFIFLSMLFVMLYTGMHNTKAIDFYFPVLSTDKIHAPAALIYFGVFAVGVIAGMAVHGDAPSGKSKKD